MRRSDTDDFFQRIQDYIDADMEKHYSRKTIAYFKQPVHVGRMEHPDGAATMRGGCGDTMEMYLRMEEDVIQDARFFTDGCGVTLACGSAATDLVRGKTLQDALKLSPDVLMRELDGLPRDGLHCAILSVGTLHKAIADYLLKNG